MHTQLRFQPGERLVEWDGPGTVIMRLTVIAMILRRVAAPSTNVEPPLLSLDGRHRKIRMLRRFVLAID